MQVANAFRVHDRHMMAILKHLTNEEGLFLGPSSGINVGGAVKAALDGGPGQTIVTMLCDSAQKYMSRLFDQDWLTENDLPPEDLSINTMIEEMKADL
jgi:cysteine synthase A